MMENVSLTALLYCNLGQSRAPAGRRSTYRGVIDEMKLIVFPFGNIRIL